MTSDDPRVTRHISCFLVLSFLISWLIWLPSVLATAGWDVPGVLGAISQLGPLGPGIAAFVLLLSTEGRAAARRLWRNAWSLKFDKKWLVPAILLPPVVIGLTVLGMAFLGQPIQWQYGMPPMMMVPIFLIIYVLNALPEELGWRGYVLPRLQTRMGALAASLLLGVVHALWHLPLHFMEGTTQSAIPVLEFAVKIVVGAIVYTWLLNNSGGAVFVVVVYHAVGNFVAGAVPYWVSPEGRLISLVLDLVVAAVIVWRYGAKRLVRTDVAERAA